MEFSIGLLKERPGWFWTLLKLFLGECSCLEGFLPYFDENGTLICHQEFLQGPCKEGEQYIISNEIDDFEPVCNLTNCQENETRFN